MRFVATLTLFVAVSILGTSVATAHRSPVLNPLVMPSYTAPFGNTYGEWSAAWWQWAFSFPVDNHPLFDQTGAQCALGNSGKVWFLGGVINETNTVVRSECVVPAGTALFFPILNVECSNVEGNGDSATALRACASGLMDLARDLRASIDGVEIRDLQRFRTQSRDFNFVLPDNNFLQFFGVDAPAGTCKNYGNGCIPNSAANDGVYLMVSPLSPGAHKIHFSGGIPDFNFALDITYNLTVR